MLYIKTEKFKGTLSFKFWDFLDEMILTGVTNRSFPQYGWFVEIQDCGSVLVYDSNDKRIVDFEEIKLLGRFKYSLTKYYQGQITDRFIFSNLETLLNSREVKSYKENQEIKKIFILF